MGSAVISAAIGAGCKLLVNVVNFWLETMFLIANMRESWEGRDLGLENAQSYVG